MRDLFYANEEMTHYKGHTIITLQDKVDNDYSVVTKKGEFVSTDTFAETETGPEGQFLKTSFATRDAAAQAAVAWIDEQTSKVIS